MKNYKFTIITVCYNAENYIKKTIASVKQQTYKNYEYIIKDGNSIDATLDVAKQMLDGMHNITYIVGKDNGIYDAMNIALDSTNGEYIYFLNAGDVFFDQYTLEKLAQAINEMPEIRIFYGNIIEVNKDGSENKRIYTEKNSKIWYYSLGTCLCHQGMICNYQLFKEKKFDLSLKICADREWQLYFLNKKIKVKALNIIISKFLVDGFSSSNIDLLKKETKYCVKKYCGYYYNIYCILDGFKKNPFILRLIQKVEKKISCK